MLREVEDLSLSGRVGATKIAYLCFVTGLMKVSFRLILHLLILTSIFIGFLQKRNKRLKTEVISLSLELEILRD